MSIFSNILIRMHELQQLIIILFLGLGIGFVVMYCFLSWSLRDQQMHIPEIKIGSDRLLMQNENRTMADEIASHVSILCLVIVPKSDDGHERTLYIKETWGKRCNILLFLGPTPDHSVPILRLTNQPIKWDRVVTGLKYVYDYYLNHVDWFFYSELKTYAVLENIRHLLYGYNVSSNPIYFTQNQLGKNKLSVDVGFIMNREALRRFIEVTFKSDLCRIPAITDDIYHLLNECLTKLGAERRETIDASNKEMFLPIGFDDGKITCVKGVDCFSNTPLAFGDVSAEDMYVLEYLIYNLRPFGITYSPVYNFN